MNDQKRPETLRALLRQLDAQGITDHRRYEATRRFLDFKAREKNIPLSGTFELTPLCNLDCKMCYVHLNREQLAGAQLLSAAQWKQIMLDAIDAGMMYARLTGGECLTYPGFKDLYLLLRSHGVEVSILSNGLLMNEQMTAFLAAHPPASVQITLYGASEDAYQRVTGHRAHRTVVENIHRLREHGIPLIIAVTPNAYMEDGEEIIRFLHGEKLPYAINSGLVKPRKETGRKTGDALPDLYAALYALRRELNGHDAPQPCDPESLPDPGSKVNQPAIGVRCGAGRSSFSIDWTGGMRPCNTFPCESESVLTQPFAEAWRKTNAAALSYPLPVECEGCIYKSTCKHCVAEHAAGAPKGHVSPAVCAFILKQIALGLRTYEKPD